VSLYYCTPADIRQNVAGTDDGTGTCAQLDVRVLQAAIGRASSRVSGYTGDDYDPTEVPDLVRDLTVQLATYYATLTYRKSMDLAATDPVYLGYADAMATLKAISAGSVTVVPASPAEPPGTPPQPSAPRVINTIPSVFSGSDSATEVTPWGNLRARGANGSGWGGRSGW
jgi:phage gp36-like protein